MPDGSSRTFSGVHWVALNVRDYPKESWGQTVEYARRGNIKVFPWGRLAHAEQGEGLEHCKRQLDNLRRAAEAWGSDTIIPNYENEAEVIPPVEIARYLYSTWRGKVGWSMQGWLPNDVKYHPICADPVLLQIFPADMQIALFPSVIESVLRDCVAHARKHGFRYVGVTYQAYGNVTHALWDCTRYHSIFPGNVVPASDWQWWFPNA